MYRDCVRLPSLLDKVMSTTGVADLIQDGMTVGMSGFTRADEAKAVSQALAMCTRERPLRISLMAGASLDSDLDKQPTEAGVLARRMPSQVDSTLRRTINAGEVMFIDQHPLEAVEQLRNHQLKLPDIAVIEAAAATEQGHIVPITSVGNSANFTIFAKRVIVGINLAHNTNLEGLHDIYIPTYRPTRTPIPLIRVDDHIGNTAIPIPPEKAVTIVINDQPDSPPTVPPPGGETQTIANHLIDFFKCEVDAGRMSNGFGPLQADIGSITNVVMCDLIGLPFGNLTMYSEVLQDSTFNLIDAGKLRSTSGSPITLSPRRNTDVFGNLERYKDELVLHPQGISNHPEVVRRLGITGINTALEFDIYGNVNSTRVNSAKMVNGIGSSGDFARGTHLAIFVTKSIAKSGNISSMVPMVSHVDHTEHDVDILVTERGLADLHGLASHERARVIIENCVHPPCQAPPLDYFEAVYAEGGHTPYLLREALAWHLNLEEYGHMLIG